MKAEYILLMFKVYLLSVGEEKRRYKIGYTRRQVEQRIKELKTGNCENFEIISVFESKWGTKIESKLHDKYRSKKIDGEWFQLDDIDILLFQESCQNIHNMFEFLSKENTWIIDRGGF